MPDQTETPRIGERWHSDRYAPGWGELEVVERSGSSFHCRGTGGEFVGQIGSFAREDLTRMVCAPVPPTESEFRVGDEVVCVDVGNTEGCPLRIGGRYTIGSVEGGVVELAGAPGVWNASRFRRLSPPAPEATATAAPVAKVDPDGRYPHTGFPTAQDLENHAIARDRDIAAIKQHVADFDRPLTTPRYPNRYVCVGVMGDGAPVKRREVKGHPASWPSCGDEEP